MSSKPGALHNGGHNQTLATLDTLANLVSVCATAPASGPCAQMLRLSTPPGAATPSDTADAVLDLAKNPTLSRAGLFLLARKQTIYEPALGAPPEA